MSPFADTPHLWLTGHLARLQAQEHLVKIQALVRGHLVRRRQEKKRNAEAVIDDVLRRLIPPAEPVEVLALLTKLGLDVYTEDLPTAQECLRNPEADQRRRAALWNAGIVLRLTGRSSLIPDVEWADYHERCRAFYVSSPPPPPPSPPPTPPAPQTPPLSFWSRLFHRIVG